MQEALKMNFPTAHLEVKIVLPIPFGVLKAAFRCLRILLRESLKGPHHDKQATRK